MDNRTMRTRAAADLLVLGLVFWGVWSLRFAGVDNVGIWSILAGVGTGAVLVALRGEPWHELGLRAGGDLRFVLSRASEAAVLALVVGSAVVALATALGYPPTQSSVLTNQPGSLSGFLLDILFGVWIGAAFGEEIFFRGFLLKKFATLFGSSRLGLASAVLAQAVWFGAGHPSQGIAGMIMAGTIGAALGLFLLTRAKGALLPLILGHGFIDTVSQTINFLR